MEPNTSPTPTLRDLLHESGAHPDELARAVGVGVSTLYAWRAGVRVPKAWRIIALAKALDLDRQAVEAALRESHRIYRLEKPAALAGARRGDHHEGDA